MFFCHFYTRIDIYFFKTFNIPDKFDKIIVRITNFLIFVDHEIQNLRSFSLLELILYFLGYFKTYFIEVLSYGFEPDRTKFTDKDSLGF